MTPPEKKPTVKPAPELVAVRLAPGTPADWLHHRGHSIGHEPVEVPASVARALVAGVGLPSGVRVELAQPDTKDS